jgi:hypothetical protein
MSHPNINFTVPPRQLIANPYGSVKYDSDWPNGDRPAPPNTLTLSGVGFGADGPNIVLFDRFSGGKNGELISATRAADIGAWKKIAWSQPRYRYQNGRLWMAGRDTSNLLSSSANIAGLMFSVDEYFTQFRYAKRVLVPPGNFFPGAAAENTLPENSTFKMSWFADIDGSGNFVGSDEQDQSIHDLCIPTYIGSGQFNIGGNTTNPRYYDINPTTGNAFYMGWSHGEENMYCHYQEGPESVLDAHDKRIEGTWFTGSQAVGHYARTQCSPFKVSSGTQLNVGYRAYRTVGWFGSAGSFTGVLPLIADEYLAIGPSSRACVWVTDSPVFSGSTKGYLLPVSAWSDQAITANITNYEELGYYHVQPVVGNLIENVTGVIS